MVKSTASQQQDTISDMNRPKSCTAGICRGAEGHALSARGLWPRTLRPGLLAGCQRWPWDVELAKS